MALTCSDKQSTWICEHVVTVAPGVEPNHVERVFTRKVDEFLQQAACWLEEKRFGCDSHGLVKLDYSGIGGQMVWIEKIWHRYRPIVHSTTVPPEREDKAKPGDYPQTYTNTPYPDVIQIFPVPRDVPKFELLARCALTLNECATEDLCIPDWIFSRYKEAIRDGVIGDLLSEGGKPYTNYSQGDKRLRKFRWWIAKARDESHRGWGKHEAEWHFPRGGFIT